MNKLRRIEKAFVAHQGYEDNVVCKDVVDEFIWFCEVRPDKKGLFWRWKRYLADRKNYI